MPAHIRGALISSGVIAAYKNRPQYQQNDYVGWIIKAKREETRLKRIKQMIQELKLGGVYMNMKHHPSSND